jgi:DNA polymerase III sliding clamp (beta) subunit (PCNA family)
MNRAKLVEILSILSKGLEKNKELPIYEHFCFTGTTVFSSNMLFTIAAPLKVPKPFAVNGYTFLQLLEAVGNDDIKFVVETDNLAIKAGKSSFELPIKTQDEFIWQEPEMKGLELDSVVADAMKYVLTTCSENQALEGFARICIRDKDGLVTLYSTDGDALTRYNTNLPTTQSIDVWLTRKFCQTVNDVTPNGRIQIDKHWVCADDGKYKVYGQNLGRSTMDYEVEIKNIVGPKFPNALIPIPLGLDQALTRARVVADIETAATNLIVESKIMYLITETPFGNVYDEMGTDHDDIDIKINAELLQTKMNGLDMVSFTPSCSILKNEKMLRLIAVMK